MNKKFLIAATIVILAILAFAYYYYWGIPEIPSYLTPGQEETTQNTVPATVNKIHMVEITEGGFKPAALKIKSGDTVKFYNLGTVSRWPISEAPLGQLMCPGFDPQHSLVHNESWSYKFNYPAPLVCFYKDRQEPNNAMF